MALVATCRRGLEGQPRRQRRWRGIDQHRPNECVRWVARDLAEDENLSPLPRSLAPLPEEALTGYLLRLAHRLDRSPARIGRITSLVTYAPSDRTPRLPTHLLLELQPKTANAFSTATRLTADEVSALGLSRHTSSYPPLARVGLQRDGKVRHNAWALSPGNRSAPPAWRVTGAPLRAPTAVPGVETGAFP